MPCIKWFNNNYTVRQKKIFHMYEIPIRQSSTKPLLVTENRFDFLVQLVTDGTRYNGLLGVKKRAHYYGKKCENSNFIICSYLFLYIRLL